MSWDRNAPTNPKYRSKAHRDERARLVKQMQRDGFLVCAQPVCVMPTRIIHAGEPWHLGHDDTGSTFIGPVQAQCNVKDGARRGNRRSRGVDVVQRWPL